MNYRIFAFVFAPMLACGELVMDDADDNGNQSGMRALHVDVLGPGSIVSKEINLDCPGACSAEFEESTSVSLVAVPDKNARLVGWTGSCSPQGAELECTINMDGDQTVGAEFCAQRACSAECGQVDDGCGGTMDCGPCPNYAFVTSMTTNGAFGGTDGADTLCNELATAADLPGTYRAWITSAAEPAASRFADTIGWVRTDGKLVARTVEDLAGLAAGGDGPFHPINLTERGAAVPADAKVWIGATSIACNDFTVAGNSDLGWSGIANSSQRFDLAGPSVCSEAHHLYCLGTAPTAEAPSLPPLDDTVRIAFVTAKEPFVDGGVEAADALCNAEASAQGGVFANRKFKALLATTSQAPAQRFDLTGPPWARPDGIRLFDRAADLATREPHTAIGLQADGKPYIERVWLGSSAVNAPAASGSDNCDDWTTIVGEGDELTYGLMVNEPWRYGGFSKTIPLLCGGHAAFVCLEE